MKHLPRLETEPKLAAAGFKAEGCLWADGHRFWERIIPGRAACVYRKGRFTIRNVDHGETAWVYWNNGKMVVQRITASVRGFRRAKLASLRDPKVA